MAINIYTLNNLGVSMLAKDLRAWVFFFTFLIEQGMVNHFWVFFFLICAPFERLSCKQSKKKKSPQQDVIPMLDSCYRKISLLYSSSGGNLKKLDFPKPIVPVRADANICSSCSKTPGDALYLQYTLAQSRLIKLSCCCPVLRCSIIWVYLILTRV